MRNYYQILELSQSAALTDIKSAFRRLSFKYHPDLNNDADAEENFKRVNEAYQVLADPLLRQMYNAQLEKIHGSLPIHSESYSRKKYKKRYNTGRNIIFVFLFFITAFLILEISPSFSSVNTINEYKSNLSKKSAEYFKNSPERTKQIDIIIRRTNSLTDMFRNLSEAKNP